MQTSIIAEGLVKRYGQTEALAGVDLAVPAGTVLGLLGPNGAGKTTAVRVLSTLVRPDAGHASICGYDVLRDAHRVRQLIGLTGQYASVDESLTGSENLLLLCRLYGQSRAEARSRSARLLTRFRLDDAGSRAARTYSGGMRRRLDLAASMVSRPKVLFLDEPTTGLDPRSRNEVWDIVRDLVSEGVTVLLTTQYLEEADQLADGIVVVDRGTVLASGTPAALKARTGAQVLVVRPVDPADLPAAVAAVAETTRYAPDVCDGAVTAAVSDPAVLPAVVRRLDAAGVAVGELALRSPSLDEAFLALTGQAPTSAGTPADARGSGDTGGSGDASADTNINANINANANISAGV